MDSARNEQIVRFLLFAIFFSLSFFVGATSLIVDSAARHVRNVCRSMDARPLLGWHEQEAAKLLMRASAGRFRQTGTGFHRILSSFGIDGVVDTLRPPPATFEPYSPSPRHRLVMDNSYHDQVPKQISWTHPPRPHTHVTCKHTIS